MRRLIVTLALLGGCDGGKPNNTLLCDVCDNDNQCAGAPCFTDKSGGHYCGQTCTVGGDDCPKGFSCTGITGTAGSVLASCFPDNESCMSSTVPNQADLSPNPGNGGGGTLDMAVPPPTPGSVGTSGGSVNLLHFGVVGDTRPAACEDTANYPTTVINGIATEFKNRNAQFVLDLGDHMYVCNNDLNTATTQMNLYMTATKMFGGTWFMTQGNHECYSGPCYAGSQNANYVAFMTALAPISQSPYYSINVDTSLGLATFVFIADNSWDNTQSTWLDQTLTTADSAAKYTIVIRHHPEGDSSVSTNGESMAIVRKHKFAVFLTGHSHLYKHMTTDNGRDLVMGNGGAPLIAGGAFFGFAMIDQLASGQLQLSIYDLSNTAQPVDVWSVGPN